MKCNKCGNKVLYGEKFCSKCGNAINIDSKISYGKHRKKAIIIIVFIAIVFLVINIITSYTSNTNGSVTRENYDKIKIGMSENKVLDILGERLMSEEVGESTYSFWTKKDNIGNVTDLITVFFKNGKVTEKNWGEMNVNSPNSNSVNNTKNNVDDKAYYTPIEVYNNQGVNGKYKDSTETKKYVIQSEEVEYWEEEYIYIGTYKQEDNKLCIEYSSRYRYDEKENKYVLAGGGYTTMFKLGKDYEELTIKSEDELVTSNGVKYLKEYPSNNTNNSIFSSKPNTNEKIEEEPITNKEEPITQIETPKLVKTYNTIKSEGKTEYNIIKILQYENGDYTYEIYWHSYGETTPSIKSKERFKTIDETLKYVIQNFEGYKLTMNDLTEE